MAIEDSYGTNGWEALKDLFNRNGLSELGNVLTAAIQEHGTDNTALIYQTIRNSPDYRERFKGNFDRVAAGKNWLSEGTYLQQENMYAEVLGAYQSSNLAKRENYAKFIANDVSVNELSNRFDAAYNRVTKAVETGDKPLVDELRRMYPGVSDAELAQSLLLGTEGSDFLRTRINIAEIKAAETETGVSSALGAGFLESQGVSRAKARSGLSKVSEQLTGANIAAETFGGISVSDLQKELETQNVLDKTSGAVNKLASQQRAQMSKISGTGATSLGKKVQL